MSDDYTIAIELSEGPFAAMIEMMVANNEDERADDMLRTRLQELRDEHGVDYEKDAEGVHVSIGGEFRAILEFDRGNSTAVDSDIPFLHEPSDTEVWVEAPHIATEVSDMLVEMEKVEGPEEAARAEYRRTRM